MRLVIVTHTFNSSKGGKEIFTWNLVNQLLNLGCKIHVVCSKYKSISHENFHAHTVSRWGKSFGIHRWTFARSARSKVKELDYDLLFTHGNVGFGDIVRVGGVHKQYVKRMIDSRDSWFGRTLYSISKTLSISSNCSLSLERSTFVDNSYKKIIVISEFLKQELLEAYPEIVREKVEVIYNGVNVNQFNLNKRREYRSSMRQELGIDEEDMTFIFVGNDYHRKGLDRLLPMLKPNSSYRLLVVGEGNRPAVDESIKNQIHWIGPVDEVGPYYAAADTLVLPSRTDGFGLVVLEALAMGLYVLVSETAGASELINDPWQGRILGECIEESDFEIKTTYLDEEWVKRRNEYATQYNWENVARRYYDVMEEVM